VEDASGIAPGSPLKIRLAIGGGSGSVALRGVGVKGAAPPPGLPTSPAETPTAALTWRPVATGRPGSLAPVVVGDPVAAAVLVVTAAEAMFPGVPGPVVAPWPITATAGFAAPVAATRIAALVADSEFAVLRSGVIALARPTVVVATAGAWAVELPTLVGAAPGAGLIGTAAEPGTLAGADVAVPGPGLGEVAAA
jgi:hypothetical protein